MHNEFLASQNPAFVSTLPRSVVRLLAASGTKPLENVPPYVEAREADSLVRRTLVEVES